VGKEEYDILRKTHNLKKALSELVAKIDGVTPGLE
jgi:hypothetical protein